MLKKWQIKILEKIDGWDDFLLNIKSRSNSLENKKLLLEMAKNEEKRPASEKTYLGNVLRKYTSNSKNNFCYDLEFDKKIRELNPDWFNKRKADENKKIIIEIAKNNEDLPDNLKNVFSSYISEKNQCYDVEFEKEIKKINPKWLLNYKKYKKEKLLELIRNDNFKKPNGSLYSLLHSLIDKNNKFYDCNFEKEAKKLKPLWFTNKSKEILQKKEQLLEMAKKGEPRPQQGKHTLGYCLTGYTNRKNKGTYDEEFDKKIKELAPFWFNETKHIKNKEQLLEIAKNNGKRPYRESLLGDKLGEYVNKNHKNYDIEFEKEIKKLRPDWFRKYKGDLL